MKTLYVYNFLNAIKRKHLIEAIIKGARQYGFEGYKLVTCPEECTPSPDDILIIWNRHLKQDAVAKHFEKAGAKVWLFENPYISTDDKADWFSVGLGLHNCIEYSPKLQDDGTRWRKLFNKPIKEWKNPCSEGTVLIISQNKHWGGGGIGFEQYRQPSCWDSQTCEQIKLKTRRPLLFRQHPNAYQRGWANGMPEYLRNRISDGTNPIVDDLRNAACTVVYTSNAATESLLEGVPVFVCGPSVYCMEACNKGIDKLNAPQMPDCREELFHRMAWAQYHISEIEKGMLHEVMC